MIGLTLEISLISVSEVMTKKRKSKDKATPVESDPETNVTAPAGAAEPSTSKKTKAQHGW